MPRHLHVTGAGRQTACPTASDDYRQGGRGERRFWGCDAGTGAEAFDEDWSLNVLRPCFQHLLERVAPHDLARAKGFLRVQYRDVCNLFRFYSASNPSVEYDGLQASGG